MISLPGLNGLLDGLLGVSAGLILAYLFSALYALTPNSPRAIKTMVNQKIAECEKTLPRDKTCVIVAVPKP